MLSVINGISGYVVVVVVMVTVGLRMRDENVLFVVVFLNIGVNGRHTVDLMKGTRGNHAFIGRHLGVGFLPHVLQSVGYRERASRPTNGPNVLDNFLVAHRVCLTTEPGEDSSREVLSFVWVS